jgi:hypothetical protein
MSLKHSPVTPKNAVAAASLLEEQGDIDVQLGTLPLLLSLSLLLLCRCQCYHLFLGEESSQREDLAVSIME